jgi:hypothetical protein
LSSSVAVRLPNPTHEIRNISLIHTADRPAISIGTEDGQSFWFDLTDEQVWRLVGDGFYYIDRKARAERVKHETGQPNPSA